MPIPNKDDPDAFRAMGYVVVYAAYVEEQVGKIFARLREFDCELREPTWPVSARLASCRRVIKSRGSPEALLVLDQSLDEAKKLIDRRNTAIHSPLYALPGGEALVRGARAADAAIPTTTAEIYGLAEELFGLSQALLAEEVRLPRHLRESAP